MPGELPDASSRPQQAERLRRAHQVRTVHRALPDGDLFSLAYTRTGPPSQTPVLVFPGGPGLGSVVPYAGLRRRASRLGLDLIMVEHRGVGLSRSRADGTDLPRSTMRIAAAVDDAAAVLDAEGVSRAVIAGSSYGSYVAQRFGVRHPDRVSAMVLDSAMLDEDSGVSAERALHEHYWEGAVTETAPLATRVRHVTAQDPGGVDGLGFVLQLLHEFVGPAAVARYLSLREAGRGRNFTRWAAALGRGEISRVVPFRMEFDLVGEIAFRELGYGREDSHTQLTQSGQFADSAADFSPFTPPSVPLSAQLDRFTWPTVLLSGDRDLRTPRSESARIAELVPEPHLIPIRRHGHSALDFAPQLALGVFQAVTLGLGAEGSIGDNLPQELVAPRSIASRMIGARLTAAELPLAR